MNSGVLPAPISENVLGSLTGMSCHGLAMDVGTSLADPVTAWRVTGITQY